MDWKTHKKLLLKDPAFRRALKDVELEYQIAREVIVQRIKHKLTQKQLAKRLKTRQSVVSRVENAKTTTSLSFLKRLAGVFNARLSVSFDA
ncbi:MAG TPA: helix-turn-helix transcriptional regulator [Patescibacteria group bacterium]|nr:helix-turn-helix transcriptional regulator [Patescibacteria group bacterium]